jgi:hypothetical protein
VPKVDMSIDNFSIKALDWKRPISLDFANSLHDEKQSNSETFVLAGINAGGKTVTLKALELFTKLICEPSDRSFTEFENFSKVANISEIDVRYSFVWPEDQGEYLPIAFGGGLWELDVSDKKKFCEFLDYPYTAKLEHDLFLKCMGIIDTKFRKSNQENRYSRLEGLRLMGVAHHAKEDGKFQLMGMFDETIMDGFSEDIFTSKGQYELDRMEMFEPILRGPIAELMGVSSQNNFDEYDFHMKDKKIVFVPHKATLLKVEEAYNLDQDLVTKLTEFNKNITAKKNGQMSSKSKSWINKNLNRVFFEAKNSHSEVIKKIHTNSMKRQRAELEALLATISQKQSELSRLESSDEMVTLREFVEEFEREIEKSNESDQIKTGYFREKFDQISSSNVRLQKLKEEISRREAERVKLEHDIMNEEPFEVRKSIEEFRKKIHPKFDTNPNRKVSKNQQYILSSLNEIDPPSIDLVMQKYPEPTSADYDKSGHDGTIGSIFNHIMKFYGKFIRDYWPEFASWGILSAYIDFPDKSTDYYSSGQKRMLKLANAMINSDPHETILIDEPELSLHIDWQRRFIEKMEVFSRNMVIATHSPDILYHHTEKVVHVPPVIEE